MRVTVTHPDGALFTYARDALDRAANIHENASVVTSLDYLSRGTFNARGLQATDLRGSLGNGINSTFAYDPVNRLSQLAHDAELAADDLTITFGDPTTTPATPGYNPAGQIVRQTRSNDAYAWTGHYNLSRAYSTNGNNQYSAVGGTPYCYDANGNLTADGSSVYMYDNENRLVFKRAQTSSVCPTWTTGYDGAIQGTLIYDPMGRLARVSVATSGGGGTQFLYDGDDLIAEYGQEAPATLLKRYVHSDAPDDPIAQYDSATLGMTSRKYPIADERGSIVGLVNADGTFAAKNTYDEYGMPGSANQGRFQYTGQVWLPEVGLYHYKARVYSPALGRFMQTDPVGYEDQMNLYAYVGNDPANATDPTGEIGVLGCRATIGCITVSMDSVRMMNPHPMPGGGSVWYNQVPRMGHNQGPPLDDEGGVKFPRWLSRLFKLGGVIVSQVFFPDPLGPEREWSVESMGKQVSGRFPETAGESSILYRRGPDGKITHYIMYGPNGMPAIRVDLVGKAHGGIPTPHTRVFELHTNPKTGKVYGKWGPTRPAKPSEIP